MAIRILALGDPHLSFRENGEEYKPMDVFGSRWHDHSCRIRDKWCQIVRPEDVVLMPGDISWAMTLEEAAPDLDFLAKLPGRKIITKGNHELWWDTISKVRKVLPAGIMAVQNDHILLENGVAICGTRGWQCPDGAFASDQDEKIFAREVGRLELSLRSVPQEVPHKIVMLHFPPTNVRQEMSPFVELMLDYGVEICVYGHLHDQFQSGSALQGRRWGMTFHLVSADYLQFAPKCIYNEDTDSVGEF
mgnify:CR=1 FL=1